ncbi:MAG: caspase family protein [Alphaproteobacteria bacterium]|nr:caspase family protein [Alphaproteobacteria bacterium]
MTLLPRNQIAAIATMAVAIGLMSARAPANADQRVALVVGESSYRYVPALANPSNDARALAAVVQQLGFSTTLSLDVDLNAFQRAIAQFISQIPTADVSVFYFAGHAMAVNGQNYIAPIDAQLADAADVQTRFVPLNSLLMQITERSRRATLIILDACRTNPFEQTAAARGFRVSRGLAEVNLNRSSLGGTTDSNGAASGTLIAFATGPGTEAADGNGAHSPFTAALLRNLGSSGLEINSVFNRVRQEVWEATQHRQLPWSQSAMVGDLYLNGTGGSLLQRRVMPPPP